MPISDFLAANFTWSLFGIDSSLNGGAIGLFIFLAGYFVGAAVMGMAIRCWFRNDN